MGAQKVNFKFILDKTENLFNTRGYHNTSISDIAAACDLSKASVYHYIPSKQALGLAVMQSVQSYFEEHIFAVALDTNHTPAERFTAYCDAIETYYEGRDGGCLIASLVSELSGSEPEFMALAKKFFESWLQALAAMFKASVGDDAAQSAAQAFLAKTQGAILFQQVFGQSTLLKQLRDESTRYFA